MNWMKEGACRGADPALFFPVRHTKQTEKLTKKAKAICSECPVRIKCKEHAIHNEAYGTWGGMDEVEREKFRQSHGLELLMISKERYWMR